MNLLKTTSVMILSSCLIAAPALADKRDNAVAAKGAGKITGTAILGGIAGGPIGFFVGAILGTRMADQGKEKLTQERNLEMNIATVSVLKTELEHRSVEIANLEKLIDEKMQLQVYFNTGQDTLSLEDKSNLESLSDFLKDNDELHITIDGHADPRGTDEYNNLLSQERANSVASTLIEQGIDGERIAAKGYGSRFSSATTGNLRAYAGERKVKIEVHSSRDSASFASVE
ncbi:MAG: outer membrane protein OmpA-like peptidoglycan-associated protein [Flavobacteriales bacterium]|jgi:outer membrane protein OmpA-like peptidoglycan-associated protein